MPQFPNTMGNPAGEERRWIIAGPTAPEWYKARITLPSLDMFGALDDHAYSFTKGGLPVVPILIWHETPRSHPGSVRYVAEVTSIDGPLVDVIRSTWEFYHAPNKSFTSLSDHCPCARFRF